MPWISGSDESGTRPPLSDQHVGVSGQRPPNVVGEIGLAAVRAQVALGQAGLLGEVLQGDYRRISVPLRSGPHAWVYVFAGQPS